MIATLFLAVAASCPIVTLPATPQHDAICVDCNTKREVPCLKPTKRKVARLIMWRDPDGVTFDAIAEESYNRWWCRLTEKEFWATKPGDMLECKGGWR